MSPLFIPLECWAQYMKNMKSIVGLWNGSYTYDSEEFEGVSIRFSLSMNLEKGEIRGDCYESVDDGGIPEPAKIKGFIDGSEISLVKQYPCLIYIDETGKFRKDETQPHPEIHYFGEVENNMANGTWEMNISSLDQGEDIVVEQITGKWEMKKEQMLFWA